MAVLADLSNELIEIVINFTYRENLVNLATTCHRIHDLSQPALKKHRDLQHKYGKTLTNIASDVFLERITTDLIKDFRIGLYVTQLRIEGWFIVGLGEGSDPDDVYHTLCSESTLSLLTEAAHDRLPLSTDLIRKSVYSGDQGPVVALLLLLLPNLRTLCIHIVEQPTMEPIDCFYLNAALDEANPKMGARLKKLPYLPKLESVDLNCAGSCSIGTVERFMQLPSLRILQLAGLSASHIETEMKHQAWDGPSTLKALIFRECGIDSRLMSSMIELHSGLECFSYSAIDMYENNMILNLFEAQPDPYWVRLSLIATSRDTLQVFQFLPHAIDEKKMTPNTVHRYLGSLRRFRNLRTVIVDFLLLFGGDLLGRHTFMTELPASVRNVLLYIPYPSDLGVHGGSFHSDDEETEGEEDVVATAIPKRDRGRPEEPVISANVLGYALRKLLEGKKKFLSNMSNLKIVGLVEEVAKEVSACGVIEALHGVGVDVSLVTRMSGEAFDFLHGIKSDGFYDKKPWYYEGSMKFQ
ncbi:MAG: hypothetical protein Q9202_005121 [Teloschistes flavicans]